MPPLTVLTVGNAKYSGTFCHNINHKIVYISRYIVINQLILYELRRNRFNYGRQKISLKGGKILQK